MPDTTVWFPTIMSDFSQMLIHTTTSGRISKIAGVDRFLDHERAAFRVGSDLLAAGGRDLPAGDAATEHGGLVHVGADFVAHGLQPRVEAARRRVADDQDAQPGGGRPRACGGPSLWASSMASSVSLARGVPQKRGSP